MIKIIEKEDYVPYKLAKLLKEKGFDWECIGYYVDDEPNNIYHSFCGEINSTWEPRCCSAPTLQMAMNWLREVYGFIITMDYDRYPIGNGETNVVGYGYNIQTKDNPEDYYRISESVYASYEEAVEEALKYTLVNLI